MAQAEPLKLVFMGTPDLAATVLQHLLAWDGGRVLAVYCQPDRPAGRGMTLKAPPVKTLALEHGLPVRQPLNFKNPDDVAALRELEPDYLLVAAYGLILPKSVLAIPARYPLNVHTSLLPRYRGAAPIQRAIMNGDTETGVTIMAMEAGLDTGPVILQQPVPIGPATTAAELHDTLAVCGGKLLITALQGLESGKLTPSPQDDANASYAAKLEKNDGCLDFSRPGHEIYARARGVTPWPGAFSVLSREGAEPLSVSILDGRPEISDSPELASLPVGTVLPKLRDKALAVRCADGLYLIPLLRPAGRKAMDAAAFMNGYLKGSETARFAPPE
ncbi:methionyl-tRNA formyltransferase [Desulfovibrio sp. OttesenSCG-928-O18]|nr:methionyl-tRNA formyltransferase [Desulfovibrio sp. OttesenSCG-928-O18]